MTLYLFSIFTYIYIYLIFIYSRRNEIMFGTNFEECFDDVFSMSLEIYLSADIFLTMFFPCFYIKLYTFAFQRGKKISFRKQTSR